MRPARAAGVSASSARFGAMMIAAQLLGCVGEALEINECASCSPLESISASTAVLRAPPNPPAPSAKTSGPPADVPPAIPLRRLPNPVHLDAPCAHARELPDVATLERLTSTGDACAAKDLALHMMRSLGRPADFERALALAAAAQDAGAALSLGHYVLFELGADRSRLATCYEVAHSTDRLALMLAFGDGVARDIKRARALTPISVLLEVIDKVDPAAPPRPIKYCSEGREEGSMRDMWLCLADAVVIRDHSTSEARAAAFDRLADEPRLPKLRQALLAYRDVEADRKSNAFLGGSGFMAGFCTEAMTMALHETYDAVLQKFAGLEGPSATAAELDAAGALLKMEEADAGSFERQWVLTHLQSPGGASAHALLVRESSRLHRKLEVIVTSIATDRLGLAGARALLLMLRRARIQSLGECPGSG